MSDVRPCAVAGSWYPGTAPALRREIDAHLAGASNSVDATPRALIAPHAGLMYSGPVAAYAYKHVANRTFSAIVLVGPSHFVGFDGVAIWPRGGWETPLGQLPVAEALASAITTRSSEVREHPAAHGREHSLEMQLPFLARLLPDVPIVPMVMGYQTRETAQSLGTALATAIQERERAGDSILLIASSDLSHYHDARTAQRMDAVVLKTVESLDPELLMKALEEEPGHACGGGPMVSVMQAARELGATHASVLRYADSGDVSGDKTAVVGYMAAAIW